LAELGATHVEVLPLDIVDERAVQHAIDSLEFQIDVLVNNAGVSEIAPAIESYAGKWVMA
jgi:NADP-dependent 3-hydroxy acid dehydrogenase YdfG